MNKTATFLFFFTIILSSCCKKQTPTDLQNECFIPMPASISANNESFELSKKMIWTNFAESKINEYIHDDLKTVLGCKIETKSSLFQWFANKLIINVINDTLLKNEGYRLQITKNEIKLNSNSEEGIFRGYQTLKQLILNNQSDSTDIIYIPTGTITDYPKYEHRGMMLDIARHFFGVKDIKRVINLISFYKINKLHLHLTDDQGWRIEIKSWPKLTEIGASTEVGGGESGYLTQADFIEIVNYAKARHIEIIPEIDMPGHTNAALASYPELNCNKVAPKLYTGTRVGFSTLCVRDEITYRFIDDVIREIAAISPSEYIHIGGDESHSTKHNDYIYFINRTFEILKKHNKKAIGWDEIADAEIPEGTLVQHWRNVENAQKGKVKGAKVILSPGSYAYLDMKYDSATVIGLDWAGLISVEKAYSWNPDTLIADISGDDIVGIEAPLWTETVQTIDDIEYMVFPRLVGYAEIGWSKNAEHNWEEYKNRLDKHKTIMDKLDINYYK